MFSDNNDTTPIDGIRKWIQDGIPIDGIPFIHNFDNLTFFQCEQLLVNIVLLTISLYLAIRLRESNNQLLSIRDSLTNINKQTRYNRRKDDIFGELGLNK